MSQVGVVVIGRNEGERLRRCLGSLQSSGAPVVYVDSGSTDGSAEWARARCSAVVDLDLSIPFTAARARNAGLERLLALHPGVELVQFVDGDCEVAPGWLETAARALRDEPGCAAVCGRRRERFPEASIYNRMCDIEWDTPVGPARSCGGDAMIRSAALRAVGGYNPAVIAGEDDELCVRLRQAGGTIRRLDAEMTVHDAAMTRFGQWWRRAIRAGHCYAEGYALHGRPPERMWLKHNRSTLISGLLVPVLALGLAWPTRGLSLLLLAWYPLQLVRYTAANRRRGLSPADARLYGAFCLLAAFPQVIGQARYVRSRLRGRSEQIIEYKGAG